MKMKTIQRAFAWALTLVMVLSAAPLGVFADGEEEQKCVCTVKCGETVKEDCPVCGGESGNPAVCVGKTQEELEAAAKLAAEEAERKAAEEAAQKTAEEEKRKAEEEAAQKAAEEGGNPPAKVESKKSEDTTGKNIAPASDDEKELNNTVETVEVKFVTNGAEENIEPMMVDMGGALGEQLPLLKKSGYTFVSWYKDQNFTEENKVTGETTFDVNTTLYAKWTETDLTPDTGNGVTVTFDFQIKDKETVAMNAGADGKLSEEFPTVDNPGYLLEGWYRNQDCSGDKVTKEATFTEPTTLYAKWVEKTYTIWFNENKGQYAVVEYKTGKSGKLSNLPDATREGFIFLGWYIGETKIDVNHIYTEDTALVAQWGKKVQVETSGGNVGITPPENFMDIFKGDERVDKIQILAQPTPAEQVNDAFKNKRQELNLNSILQFDLSIETLDADGKKIDNISEIDKLIQFSFENIPGESIRVFRIHNGQLEELNKSNGTAEGYRYSDGTLTIWASRFSPYAVISNTVAVTVTFDPMGGTADPKTMTTGTDGKLQDTLPTPTRTGYTFDGWYFNKNYTGNKIAQGDTFLQDCTVYAKWNPNTYTVTFHDNYNDPEVTSKQTFTYDVAQNLDCGSTIRRDYYTLSGWAETSGGPKKFAPTETVQSLIPSGNKDLYALWTYAPRQVTFDADGGKIKKGDTQVDAVVVDTQEKPINTVSAKDVPVPELREGYYFGGWYTRKDGKGDLVKTGEAKEPTVFTADATVYAYWIKFEPVTVTFKCQGGAARIGSTDVKEFTMQTKWPGVLDGTPSTPGRSGYKFEGWYTAAGVKVDEDTLFLRNSTVYARWKRAVSITGNPRTGDQVQLEAAIGILAAAAIGLGATVVLKKRKEK